MAYRIPTCRRCGQQHYNIQPCAEHAAAVDHAERMKVLPHWRTVPEGTVPWGDRLTTLDRQAENVLRQKRGNDGPQEAA